MEKLSEFGGKMLKKLLVLYGCWKKEKNDMIS